MSVKNLARKLRKYGHTVPMLRSVEARLHDHIHPSHKRGT